MTLELHSTDSGDVYAMTDPIACSSTPFRQRITCTHHGHSTTGKHSSWYAVLAFFVPHRALMYRRLVNQRSSTGHPVPHYLVRQGRTDEAALVTRNTTAKHPHHTLPEHDRDGRTSTQPSIGPSALASPCSCEHTHAVVSHISCSQRAPLAARCGTWEASTWRATFVLRRAACLRSHTSPSVPARQPPVRSRRNPAAVQTETPCRLRRGST